MTKITFFCKFLAILVIFDISKNDHFWDIFWRPFFGHFEVVQIWLAKVELFSGFPENSKKGSKKWSKKWSFLGPQNVQNDQNLQLFACYPLRKCQGVQKLRHFLITFFQGSKNSSSPPNDFLKKREIRCLKIVKKREITFFAVLAILGFLEIPYTPTDDFCNFCHFWFVFFLCFWTSKNHNFWKIGFFWSKNTIFCQFLSIFVSSCHVSSIKYLMFLSFHFFHFLQKVYFTTWRIFSFFTFVIFVKLTIFETFLSLFLYIFVK